MATWHHPCRAIFLGKVIQRPHRAHLKLYIWNSNGVHIIITVQLLILFARMNFNSGSAAQLKIVAMWI